MKLASVRWLCCALGLAAMGSGPVVMANAPVTWNFDVQTTGNDVSWTSPTPVDPSADSYIATLHTTLVEARVRYLIFDFNVDVTDQIPPELQEVTTEVDGPAPALFVDQPTVFPLPPESPAVSGNLRVQLDASGFGNVSFTDVFLGTADVEIPGFGVQTVQITRIRFAGSVTVEEVFSLLGDMNCDGSISVTDIGPFVLALTDPNGYAAQFPDCNPNNGDTNGDGQLSVGDIGGFVLLLTGG